MNTATFWPDWLGRLDRVLGDSGRWLASIPLLTTMHIRMVEDAKQRLKSLIVELKTLNSTVIGGDPRDASDRVHELEAALESAVQHIDDAVALCHREPDFTGDEKALHRISAALKDIEKRATRLVGPVELFA